MYVSNENSVESACVQAHLSLCCSTLRYASKLHVLAHMMILAKKKGKIKQKVILAELISSKAQQYWGRKLLVEGLVGKGLGLFSYRYSKDVFRIRKNCDI